MAAHPDSSFPHPRVSKNVAVIDLGSLSDLEQFVFELPQNGLKVEGKVFLNSLLQLTGAEISVNKLAPGQAVPFYHRHQLNEEIYIFLEGQGEFQVDDCVFPVSEGTIVRVDCEGVRCWRNRSDQPLYYIVIQTRANSYTGETSEDGVGVEKRVSWVGKTPL